MQTESISILILSVIAVFYLLIIKKQGLTSPVLRSNTGIYLSGSVTRKGFFDFAKGVAILAVLVIHTVFVFNIFSEEFSVLFQGWNEHINRLARFAIPVFFTCSGTLLFLKGLDKGSLKNFYLPKIKRLFIPYALFSVFATVFISGNLVGFSDYLITPLKDILTGRALPPYWFIPVLFQLYLIYPLIWYLLVVKRTAPVKIFVVSFVFSLVSYFLFSPSWLNWQDYLGGLIFFGPYLFFFVLGIVLKPLFFARTEEVLQWLFKIKFFYFALLVLVIYFFIGTVDPLSHYFNVRLVYGPTVMLLLFYLHYFLKEKSIGSVMERIGRQSLYIYLLHFIILLWLKPLIHLLIVNDIHPALIFILVFFLNFAITYGAICLTRKVVKILT